MTDKSWFSSKVRCVCLVENHNATSFMDLVFVFRAKDFNDAFKKALELGYKQEEEWLNIYTERVRWRFKEILALDIIKAESLDGVEVNSESFDVPADQEIPFDSEFYPQQSEPKQTVF